MVYEFCVDPNLSNRLFACCPQNGLLLQLSQGLFWKTVSVVRLWGIFIPPSTWNSLYIYIIGLMSLSTRLLLLYGDNGSLDPKCGRFTHTHTPGTTIQKKTPFHASLIQYLKGTFDKHVATICWFCCEKGVHLKDSPNKWGNDMQMARMAKNIGHMSKDVGSNWNIVDLLNGREIVWAEMRKNDTHPKNPDPSKNGIWRTRTIGPLLYRFNPFHWRVQGFLGHVKITMVHHLRT